jgi:ribosomal protein L40E
MSWKLPFTREKHYQFAFKCRKCGHSWLLDCDDVYPEMKCRKCKYRCLPYRRHDRQGPCAK